MNIGKSLHDCFTLFSSRCTNHFIPSFFFSAMEMVGYRLRAPKGVKLSKPPPRKLTPEEIIKERLQHTSFSSGIQELSNLDQSRHLDVNDNDWEGLGEMTSGIPNQTEIDAQSSCSIKDVCM